ncbi:MAG: NAD kinase [Flavobacteriales bacterium]|jgi:NAD+ kinase|nr:NAD kinase [Flavobacteriales bacterium]|tara:strand:- start:16805 stop:17683 length:879 start_codon:yes stop_codon:yes gene_type:complete
MKVAVYGKQFQDDVTPFVLELFQELEKVQMEVIVYEPFYNFLSKQMNLNLFLGTYNSYEELKNGVDLFVSIGGDGTILDATTIIRDSEIPIIGVNTGRLGFLADIAKNEIPKTIIQLVNKRFTIDRRVMLKLETDCGIFGDLNFALNEVTISRKDTTSMITISTYINNQFLNSYWADGLIISTPTGSTGYSLSCGGPIVMPGSNNFIITPIAPHNLNVRPLVISDEYTIKVKVEGRENQFLVALDSRIESLESGVELIISKERFKTKMIETDTQDFSSTLRNKLLWGLDKRN